MKKIFHFAIAAIAILGMAACSNSENKTEGSEASAANEASVSATEASTEATEAKEEVKEQGPITIELAPFSFDVPEGYTVDYKSDNEVTIVAEKKNVNVKKITVSNYATTTKNHASLSDMKNIGPKTIGGNKFDIHYWEPVKEVTAFLDTKEADAYIRVTCKGFEANDKEWETLLSGLKVNK